MFLSRTLWPVFFPFLLRLYDMSITGITRPKSRRLGRGEDKVEFLTYEDIKSKCFNHPLLANFYYSNLPWCLYSWMLHNPPVTYIFQILPCEIKKTSGLMRRFCWGRTGFTVADNYYIMGAAAADDENFCLRWNDYEKKYAETFRTLR